MRDEDATLYAGLTERLRAAGLGRVLDDVLALARPAVSLRLTRVNEADLPVGACKVGGTADLPGWVVWPEWRGLPLPFIAQVRLEEVAPLDPEGDLPHHGLLSFFYALNGPDGNLRLEDDPAAWRVLYTADTTALERRTLPTALASGLETAFPACAGAPSRRLTLPPDVNGLAAARGFTNDERLGLIEVVIGDQIVSFDELMDHHLLGYPYTLNDPHPFLEAYLERHGFERPLPGDQQDTSPARHQPPLDELHQAADDEWRLLLQVYSNEEAEMDWAGGGVLHVGIARADLAVRDFSRVWVNLDFI